VNKNALLIKPLGAITNVVLFYQYWHIQKIEYPKPRNDPKPKPRTLAVWKNTIPWCDEKKELKKFSGLGIGKLSSRSKW